MRDKKGISKGQASISKSGMEGTNLTSAHQNCSERRDHQLQNHFLLAPANWRREHRFRDVVVDDSSHSRLIGAIQRFRGKSYLEDGALQAKNLTPDGRHCQPADNESWHLVAQNEHGEVITCARYYPIAHPRFESTVASKSALARSPEWHGKVKRVVENSIGRANARGANFAELGGWCVASDARNTSQALRSVLCMYALGEILGGTIGLSTATKRHSSSSILQRLGAVKAALNGEVLPPYFEPSFDCEMELLQFDSNRPATRYEKQVAYYCHLMKTKMRVVCSHAEAPTCVPSLVGLWQSVGVSVPIGARHLPARSRPSNNGPSLDSMDKVA